MSDSSLPNTTLVGSGTHLERAVTRQLDLYFEHLEGTDPMPLYDLVIKAVERPLLIYALRQCHGNQVQTAKLLGINRNTLRKKLMTHHLLTSAKDEEY